MRKLFVKELIKRIILKIIKRERASSESYIKYLKKLGMTIGDGTHFYYVDTINIDTTRPWLIEIGKNVLLTKGVTLLTHGYDLSVLLNYYGELYGSSGKIKIGDNVFVGVNSTILKGVTVGNNVIIGANSLVNKDIPSNVVVAGNPAKIIMTLEDYRNKRKEEYIEEAKELVIEYKRVYGMDPSYEDLREFFPIFLKRENSDLADELFMSFEVFKNNFFCSSPLYDGIDEFIKNCL